MVLSEACRLITDRISVNDLSLDQYISTENILPDKGGVTLASSKPESGSVTKFEIGDILISNIRPYFKKIWKATFNGGCSPDVMCFRAHDPEINDYIYYNLSQQEFFDFVMAGANGAKMPRGSKTHTLKWEILDLPNKEKIANVLSSLDDKIETNRAINARLEELATAIFKSWFIDFEPFADGEFGEDEYDILPKGWQTINAEEWFKINIGKTPPRKEFEWFSNNDEDITWCSISDLGKSNVFISSSSEYLTQEAVDKFNVVVVPKGTVLLSFKLTIGKVAIATKDLTTNEAIARFYINEDYEREYLYFSLKLYDYNKLGNTSSIATAVNSKIIKSMTLVKPTKAVLEKFHNIVHPIFERMLSLEEETTRLASLRDTLLPRLMSGELIPE